MRYCTQILFSFVIVGIITAQNVAGDGNYEATQKNLQRRQIIIGTTIINTLLFGKVLKVLTILQLIVGAVAILPIIIPLAITLKGDGNNEAMQKNLQRRQIIIGTTTLLFGKVLKVLTILKLIVGTVAILPIIIPLAIKLSVPLTIAKIKRRKDRKKKEEEERQKQEKKEEKDRKKEQEDKRKEEKERQREQEKHKKEEEKHKKDQEKHKKEQEEQRKQEQERKREQEKRKKEQEEQRKEEKERQREQEKHKKEEEERQKEMDAEKVKQDQMKNKDDMKKMDGKPAGAALFHGRH